MQRAICGLRALIRMVDEREKGEHILCRTSMPSETPNGKEKKGGHRRGDSSETPKTEERENALAIIARGGLSKTPRRGVVDLSGVLVVRVKGAKQPGWIL